jgi:hypothetical protein
MKPIVRLCSIIASLLVVSARIAAAQTTAVGPYYSVPSWDQTIACTAPASCPRFVVLSNMDSNAVLDRETGLVWQRSPSDTKVQGAFAQETCSELTLGDRQGWRLPTLPELKSLVQPSNAEPALPNGHPFTNVHFGGAPIFDVYWTSTQDSLLTDRVDVVGFHDHNVGGRLGSTDFAFLWCVRGGAGVVH